MTGAAWSAGEPQLLEAEVEAEAGAEVNGKVKVDQVTEDRKRVAEGGRRTR